MVFHNLMEKEKDLNIMIRNILLLAVHVIQLGHVQRLISRNLCPGLLRTDSLGHRARFELKLVATKRTAEGYAVVEWQSIDVHLNCIRPQLESNYESYALGISCCLYASLFSSDATGAGAPPPRKRVSPGTNNSPGRPFLRKCNRIIFLLYNLHQQICLKILYLVNLTNGECYCSSLL